MTALTAEDIAVAREQGDLKALLMMAAGLTPAAPGRSAAEAAPARLPRSRPGAWPDGTRAPDAVPAVREALAHWWPERHSDGGA